LSIREMAVVNFGQAEQMEQDREEDPTPLTRRTR
jgi:hypothetical protein